MEDQQANTEAQEPSPEYAIIEIFGHRRLAGRITEVERFGTKMLRIDIPEKGKFDQGFTSQMYGGASLFSVTPCDLAAVERMNKPYEPARALTYQEEEEDGSQTLGDEENPF